MEHRYDPTQGMKWYNFLKWFIIFSLAWGVMSFVANFNSGGYTYSDISRLFPEYVLFSTLQLICNSILAIALIISLFNYSPHAPNLCLALIGSTVLFSVLIFVSAGSIATDILPTLLGNCLGAAIFQSINFFYLRQRLIKKYWPARNKVKVVQEIIETPTEQMLPQIEQGAEEIIIADPAPTPPKIDISTLATPVITIDADETKQRSKKRAIIGQWKGFLVGLLIPLLFFAIAIPVSLTHQKQEEAQKNNQISNKVAQLAFYKCIEEQCDILIEEFVSIGHMEEEYEQNAVILYGTGRNLWAGAAAYILEGRDTVNGYYVEFVREAPDKAKNMLEEYRRLSDIAYSQLNRLSEKRDYAAAGAAIQNVSDSLDLQKQAKGAYDATYKDLIESMRKK